MPGGGGWSFADTWQSGIYLVRIGSSARARGAVRRPTSIRPRAIWRESSRAICREQFTTGSRSGRPRPIAAPTGRHNHLNKDCLYVALGLLLTETLLAWRFGHRQ